MLRELRYLSAQDCKLEDLDPLALCQNLKFVDLGFNSIRSLNFLQSFRELRFADLSGNQIETLPQFLGNSGLQIREFSDHSRMGMILGGNPLQSQLLSALRAGSDVLKRHLLTIDCRRENLEFPDMARFLLVGGGQSGKTSLARRLCQERFDPSEPPTTRIDIKEHKEYVQGRIVNFTYWDFGGQELMHSTHRFFFSNRAIFLVVLSCRKEHRPDYWLKFISLFSREAPIVLVISGADEDHGFFLNTSELKEKYPNIYGCFRVSAKTNQGIDELRRELWKLSEKHTFSFPAQARAVMQSLGQTAGGIVEIDNVWQAFSENSITESNEQRTLLSDLHECGHLLWYQNCDELRRFVVQDPQLLINAVYSVVTSQAGQGGKGWLTGDEFEDCIRKMCPNIRAVGLNFVEALMGEFELCFIPQRKLGDGAKRYLLPSALQYRPDNLTFEKSSALSVVFEYEFLARSLVHRVLVKVGDSKNANPTIWRSGFLLRDGNTTVLVESDDDLRRLSIWIQGDDARFQRRRIQDVVRSVNMEYYDQPCRELIPLPGYTDEFVDSEEIDGLRAMDVKEYVCGRLRVRFNLQDLLEGGMANSGRPVGFR